MRVSALRVVSLCLLTATAASAAPAPETRFIDLHDDGRALKVRYTDGVVGLGDVNGDGHLDLAVPISDADHNGREESGSVHVVFGPAHPGKLKLRDLPSGGFRIDGAGAKDRAGQSVAGAGDVNGDGLDDIVIGAPHAENSSQDPTGIVYVVFGKDSNDDNVDLLDFHTGSSMDGFRVEGDSFFTGWDVDGLGDVNSDGLSDIVIGFSLSGVNYVVFGKDDTTPVDLTMIDLGLPGAGGYRIFHPNATTESWAASAGDVNGDGRGDVYITSSTNGKPRLRGWVVFGKEGTSEINVNDEGVGFQISPVWSVGGSVADVPGQKDDLNGDGLGDIVVAHNDDVSKAYVIFGRKNPKDIDLNDDIGNRGYRIRGYEATSQKSHFDGATGTPDLNGDGIPEVLLGTSSADFHNRNGAGSAYVVYGKKSTRTLSLKHLGKHGYRIDGAQPRHFVGSSVAGPGNVGGGKRSDVVASGGGTRVVFHGP